MKYNGWQNIATIQFKEIISELVDAKQEQKALMLISPTGLGKTNAIKAFQAKHPKHTYVFTMGDSYTVITLLTKILDVFGLTLHHWKNAKHLALSRVTKVLNDLYNEGHQPVFILDEAENCKIPALKAIKEIYDAIVGRCGIVLIGTDQLIDQLNKKSHGQSVPQLRRRFKAGTRFITPLNKAKDFRPFFDAFIPGQPDLQDLLIEICDNYGELHDYLDPYLRHCQKRNQPVSEEGFRLYNKIPKLRK